MLPVSLIYIQYVLHKIQDEDNPETLATLGTEDTGRRSETVATLGTEETG
jgi:hypothetical protein